MPIRVERLLRGCAALFEVRYPRTALDRSTAWLLALIVVAGILVRFWGLGAVGLHGDEKTMALPTMQLIESGSPRMPSGMFYPRALAQVYLMAGSVEAFGQSEWALRLPSAVCGVLLILLTWAAGRRFLEPGWNLALTAAVAFLPDFIEDAQTARMYVFLVASVGAYLTLLFHWERTGRTGFLIAAVAAMLVGLQFHTLAIFAAFLVFIPGLLQGDARKFWLGMAAFAVIVASFFAIKTWIGLAYPQSVGPDDAEGFVNGPHAVRILHLGLPWAMAACVPALLLSWFVARTKSEADVSRGALQLRAVATLLLAAALMAAVTLHYHAAAMLAVAGLIIAHRAAPVSVTAVALYIGVVIAIAVSQGVYLHLHSAGSVRQIAGLMLGWPSVWPFLSSAQSSPIAGVLAAIGLACGLWRLAHGKPVPDFVLFLFLGVWLPLVMIGFMRWDIPPRYAQAQILPLLIGAFATAQWLTAALARRATRGEPAARDAPEVAIPAGLGALAAAVGCILVVNPLHAAHSIDSGYTSHPDHKGAAEFVKSLHLGPRDIVIAEDVLQQTYYLGHVDFWLVNKQVAAPFMHEVDGRWLDFYTNTPNLGTGRQLEQLIDRPGRGNLYIIGSGENWEDGRGSMRAFGISEVLNSPQLKVVYRGRDGLTEVWKAEAPPAAAVATSAGTPVTATR
jgi:hypothetical protein